MRIQELISKLYKDLVYTVNEDVVYNKKGELLEL